MTVLFIVVGHYAGHEIELSGAGFVLLCLLALAAARS